MTSSTPRTSTPRKPGSVFSLTRAGSSHRITWVSIVGILLVPFVIGGLLVWALWNPTERLHTVDAAVVNLDSPVTVDGHVVPLGRELAAGLLDNTKDNFNWVLTNASDARTGLAQGRYTAVVTIPKNFSAAATSSGGSASAAHQATIDVQTSSKSKLIDPTISQALTTVASGVFNKQLTTTYLENVFVGFNSLHSQLGQAAQGATALSNGLEALTTGSQQTASAAGEVATGTSALAGGLSTASTGATQLSAGANALATGAAQVSSGLNTLQQQSTALPQLSGAVSNSIAGVGQELTSLAQECGQATNGNTQFCQQLSLQAAAINGVPAVPGVSPAIPGIASYATQLNKGTIGVVSGISASSDAVTKIATGSAETATGLTQLTSGLTSSAVGAGKLAAGTQQLSTGLSSLSTGIAQSATGSVTLADGLDTAVQKIPNYSSSERSNLASVAASPVATKSNGISGFGEASIPLFASLALWLGGLATFIVLQAYSRRALLTSRRSINVAISGCAPGIIFGALQGVLLAAVMQPALQLDAGHWFGFAGVAAATGIAFAIVNHGIVTLFGGVGRFISMLIIVIALASGIVSTSPAFFSGAMSWLPLNPAMTALQGVVSHTGGIGTGLSQLVLWALIGFVLSWVGVARRRVIAVAQILPAE